MTKPALLVLAAALGGCALMAPQQENLLVKGGFEKRAAESSERDLPPREMVDRWDGEKTVYLYADPDGCRCVYAGATAQYVGSFAELCVGVMLELRLKAVDPSDAVLVRLELLRFAHAKRAVQKGHAVQRSIGLRARAALERAHPSP